MSGKKHRNPVAKEETSRPTLGTTEREEPNMNLTAFLKQNAMLPENQKVVVSDRFQNPDGTPALWEIRAITSGEEEKIKKDCTRKAQVPGRKNLYLPETDMEKYQLRLAAACTVCPNLNDKELQDSYGVMGADDLLQEMLLPGEFAQYLDKVSEITGFDIDLSDKVDEAKN